MNVVDSVEVAVLVIDVDGLFTVVSVEVTDVDTEEVTLLVNDDERLVVKLEVNVVDNDEVMVDVDDVVCVLVTVVWSQFRKLPRLNSFRAKLSFEVSILTSLDFVQACLQNQLMHHHPYTLHHKEFLLGLDLYQLMQ